MIALELDVPLKILVSSVCMANKEAPPATPTSLSKEWGMLRVIIRGFTCGTPSRTSHFRISSTSTPFRSSSTLIVTLSIYSSLIRLGRYLQLTEINGQRATSRPVCGDERMIVPHREPCHGRRIVDKHADSRTRGLIQHAATLTPGLLLLGC